MRASLDRASLPGAPTPAKTDWANECRRNRRRGSRPCAKAWACHWCSRLRSFEIGMDGARCVAPFGDRVDDFFAAIRSVAAGEISLSTYAAVFVDDDASLVEG